MVHSTQSIQSILHSHREELLHLGVSKLSIFGSVARGENHHDSDVDLLVQFQIGKKNFDNFMDLSFKLEDLLQVRIDLLTEDSLKENFKKSVLSEAIPLEI